MINGIRVGRCVACATNVETTVAFGARNIPFLARRLIVIVEVIVAEVAVGPILVAVVFVFLVESL